MKHGIVFFLGLLLIAMLCLPGAGKANDDLIIHRLVVFGDSLSDQGKLNKKLSGGMPLPPYWKGRFSDGPVWTDVLAKQYPMINEAEGGAAAVDYRRFSSDMKYKMANTLEHEITQFQKRASFRADDLVIIWIGGNDYLTYLWTQPRDIERVILEHVIQIRRMQRLGAKHFLVINLPDMGKTPQTRKTRLSARMSDVTEYHNARMTAVFEESFDPGFVRIFDAAAIFSNFINSPQDYKFEHIGDSCYTGDYWGIPWRQSRAQSSQPSRQLTEQEAFMEALRPGLIPSSEQRLFGISTRNCHGYLYMDAIHPTSYTHRQAARLLDEYIKLQYSR